MSIKDLTEQRKREQELMNINAQLDEQQKGFASEFRTITSAKKQTSRPGSRAQVKEMEEDYYYEDSLDKRGHDVVKQEMKNNHVGSSNEEDYQYGSSDGGKDYDGENKDEFEEDDQNDNDKSDSEDYMEEKQSGVIGIENDQIIKTKKDKNLDQLGGDMLKRIDDAKAVDGVKRLKDYDELQAEQSKKENVIYEQNMIIDEIRSGYEELKVELATKENSLNELQKKGTTISDESSRFVKQIKEISEKLTEEKKKNTEMKKKSTLWEKERLNMNVQFEAMIKDKKKLELDINKKDQKVNKLTEDLDKLKLNQRGEKIQHKQNINSEGSQAQQLANENKKLEKQRNELLIAFKKQLKLIDLLKRQKTHQEAAQMLKFTEEQFIQALELGGKLS